MRKLFIALAASLLISVGSTAQMNQVPVRSLAQAMKEKKAKAETIQTVLPKRAKQHADDEEEEEDEGYENEDGEEWWNEYQDIDFDGEDNDFEFEENKNAQGILSDNETEVNVGDEFASKRNTSTLNVGGKIAETQSKRIRRAIKTANNLRDKALKTIKRRKREAMRVLRQAKAKAKDQD